MITALRAGEIDVGIGLTEGWVAGLGKNDLQGDGGYRIIGTYVETPLCMSTIPRSVLVCDVSIWFAMAELSGMIQAGRFPPAPIGRI